MIDRDATRSVEEPRGDRARVRARLIAVYPRELAWELVLGDAPVVVGRALLRHATVSRRHVELRCEGGGHVVADLGSHNGAHVDGVRLGDRAVVLADGAVLQLGEVFAVYERISDGDALADDVVVDALPGRAAAIVRLRARLARAAPDPSTILVLGETGTGKEWIARELHRQSGRAGPLVALNCAALAPQLVESQLFGHVRGAFTGAATSADGLFRAADGGTLFLDEIGELAAELQPKLLRVLQDREVLAVGATRAVPVDVRVIAATNRELATAVEQGTFRRDLYARLALTTLVVPPLRARRVDLLAWLDRLHAAWCAARDRRDPPLALAPDAVEAILLHVWPDNLRGIDRLVHALATEPSDKVARADLPEWLAPERAPEAPAAAARRPPDREEFVAAFAELAGNVRALARRFDRDRRQIYRWIEAYGLRQRHE